MIDAGICLLGIVNLTYGLLLLLPVHALFFPLPNLSYYCTTVQAIDGALRLDSTVSFCQECRLLLTFRTALLKSTRRHITSPVD